MPDLYVDLHCGGRTLSDLRKRPSRPRPEVFAFFNGLLTAWSLALMSERQDSHHHAKHPLNCGYAGSRVAAPANCHRPR